MNTRIVFIMMILICSPLMLNAEALVLPNPTTGEVGFWMPRADMEAATFALLRVPVLEKEIADMVQLRKSDLQAWDTLFASYEKQEKELSLYQKGFWFVLVVAAVGTVGGFVLGTIVK